MVGVVGPVATPAPRKGPTDAQLDSWIRSCLAKGQPPEQVHAELLRRGIAEPRASSRVLATVKSVAAGRVKRRGLVEALIGIGLLIAGAAITLATYAKADAGESYIVTTGLFVVGGLALVRGTWTGTVRARRILDA